MKIKVTNELMDSIIRNFREGLSQFMISCVHPALSSIHNETDRTELADEIGEDLADCLVDYTSIDIVLPNVLDRYNTEENMKGTRDAYTSSLDP